MVLGLVLIAGLLLPAGSAAAAPTQQKCEVVGLVCGTASVSWSGGGSCHPGWDSLTSVCRDHGYTGLVHSVTFTVDGNAPGRVILSLSGFYDHPDGSRIIVVVMNGNFLLSGSLSYSNYIWTPDYSGTGCGVKWQTHGTVSFESVFIQLDADICDGFT